MTIKKSSITPEGAEIAADIADALSRHSDATVYNVIEGIMAVTIALISDMETDSMKQEIRDTIRMNVVEGGAKYAQVPESQWKM